MSAYNQLRTDRRKFVDEYIKCGIATDAMRVVRPHLKKPNVEACKWMANPMVQAAIVERENEATRRAGLRHVKIIEEIAVTAFADVGKLTSDSAPAHRVKLEALKILDAKLAPDPKLILQHQGPDGGPIQTEEVTPLEVARRIAFMLHQGLRAAEAAPSDQPAPDSGSSG